VYPSVIANHDIETLRIEGDCHIDPQWQVIHAFSFNIMAASGVSAMEVFRDGRCHGESQTIA